MASTIATATDTNSESDEGGAVVDVASFTDLSAAGVSVAAYEFGAMGQEMLYATSQELDLIAARNTTADGEKAVKTLVRRELAPLRRALLTAPPATTWFVVRPLTVSVDAFDAAAGTASASVWVAQLISRKAMTAPEITFVMVDLEFVWVDGVWLADNVVSRPGPAPRLGTEQWPVTAVELETRLEGHRLIDPLTHAGWGVE